MPDFDLIVIGAGPGGYVCAIRAAQLGLRVALVERRAGSDGAVRLGGTCLNVGCIPSKALLDSSEHYANATKVFAEHGVKVGDVAIDVAQMMKRKAQVVEQLTGGIAGLMRKNKITVLTGTGRLAGLPGAVEVTAADGKAERHQAKHIVLALGSTPVELPFLTYDGVTVVHSDHAIAFDHVPERLVVVGGGVIGLELGSVWSRLGSQVTVVEFLPQIAPTFDPDVSTALQMVLTKQGLAFHLQTKVTGIEQRAGKPVLKAQDAAGKAVEFAADVVLVAVGRRPLSDGLEAAGVVLDEKKRVKVDAHFRTNLKGVYAIGDLIPGPMLAHKAEEDGVAVAEQIAGKAGHVDYDLVPGVVYTWPELASVGINETEAQKRGTAIKVGRFPFMALGRARAAGEVDGFVKIIADAKTDRVLGAAVMGARASDLIAEIAAVMSFGGSAEDIARTCHAHPTFAEAVKEAAMAVDGRAIHM